MTITRDTSGADLLRRLPDPAPGHTPMHDPLLELTSTGRFTIEHLGRLLAFEARILRSELSAYALAATRFNQRLEDVYLLHLQDMVHQAKIKLVRCLPSLPVEPRGVGAHPAGFDAYAYSSFLTWLALNADRAGFGAASLVDVDHYYATSQHLGAWLRASDIDAPEEAIAYYEGGEPERLRREARAFVEAGLEAGDDPEEAARLGHVMAEVIERFWRASITV